MKLFSKLLFASAFIFLVLPGSSIAVETSEMHEELNWCEGDYSQSDLVRSEDNSLVVISKAYLPAYVEAELASPEGGFLPVFISHDGKIGWPSYLHFDTYREVARMDET